MQLAALTVCLSLSQALGMASPMQAAVLREINAIWQPNDVTTITPDDGTATCDRRIVVRSDAEVLPEDHMISTALAWVPFVGTYPRQLIFLRLDRVRTLVGSLSPGDWATGIRDQLAAKLAGRVLAHELGHILLNSRGHEPSGLMRERYQARDVLRAGPSAYALSAPLRAQLFSGSRSDATAAVR